LELGSIDPPSAGPCLGTRLGETFLLEIVFLEGVFFGLVVSVWSLVR